MSVILKLDHDALDKSSLEELEQIDLDGHLSALKANRDELNGLYNFETTGNLPALAAIALVELEYKRTIYLVNKRNRMRREAE